MRKPTKPQNEDHKSQEPRLLSSNELQQVTGGNVLKTRHDTVLKTRHDTVKNT